MDIMRELEDPMHQDSSPWVRLLGSNNLFPPTTSSPTAERITPLATFATIEGEDASVARVTEVLSKTEYVHLACYGMPDRKRPFESAFALHDGHLKIEDIMRSNLRQARFGYLSAYRITVGYEGSPDEVIHLAAAMRFHGFRSVVGTMWAVDDEECSVCIEQDDAALEPDTA